jgi:N-acyl-D-aspartate/D-glutamate deacylase
LLLEEELEVSFVYHHGNERDVRRILQHPLHMIGSDGIQSGQRPHPRLFGTFPRFVGHFVRDHGLLPLETAIKKITALPAERLGLRDRGQIKEGYAADVAVFDHRSFSDHSTYEDPCQLAEGIELLLVNGQIVRDARGLQRNLAGQLVSRGY